MIDKERGIYFNPDLTGLTDLEGRSEPRRKRRETTVGDYLLPMRTSEFADLIPPHPGFHTPLPLELMAAVMPHVPFKEMRHAHSPVRPEDFRRNFELVLIGEDEANSSLGVQIGSRSVISEGLIDASVQDELRRLLQTQFPDEYQKLVTNMKPLKDPRRPARYWNVMIDIYESRTDNEIFDVVNHVATQAPSGSIRIETHEASDTMLVRSTRDSESGSTSTVTYLYEEKLVQHIFVCTPAEQDGQEVIWVNARIPWVGYGSTGDKMADVEFVVHEEGIEVSEEQMSVMMSRLNEEKRDLVVELGLRDEPEAYLKRWLKSNWTHEGGEVLVRTEGRYTDEHKGNYRLTAFGQELQTPEYNYGANKKSTRVFDSRFNQPTTRDIKDVTQEIYLTDQEIEEADRIQGTSDEAMKNWWVNEILPLCKEWSQEQANQGAEYLITNAIDPVTLIREKLRGSTRLAVVGLFRHPLQDDLVKKLLDEVPNIDFVAVQTREPGDKNKGVEENNMFASIEVKPGIFVEMSHDEAKKRFPNKYKDPKKPVHAMDSVIGRARLSGVDIVYAEAGVTYKEITANTSQRIAEYMQSHPDAKGIFFTTLLNSIKWPGYKNEEDLQAIGFNRPFVDMYSLANAHYSDISVELPAHALDSQFPGGIYNLAQFEMSKGFGTDWRNMRQSVLASAKSKPFAIDNIASTPFAEQVYLDYIFPEIASWPLEELWQMQGGCGAVKVDWGKLIDGVIIYPSDKPLPALPTQAELFNVAAEQIGQMLKMDEK